MLQLLLQLLHHPTPLPTMLRKPNSNNHAHHPFAQSRPWRPIPRAPCLLKAHWRSQMSMNWFWGECFEWFITRDTVWFQKSSSNSFRIWVLSESVWVWCFSCTWFKMPITQIGRCKTLLWSSMIFNSTVLRKLIKSVVYVQPAGQSCIFFVLRCIFEIAHLAHSERVSSLFHVFTASSPARVHLQVCKSSGWLCSV